MTSNTATENITNPIDHTIGHCRAQRQELYSTADMFSEEQAQSMVLNKSTKKPMIFSFKGSDEDWADCREELERWGMEIIEFSGSDGKKSRE